jgi:4-hydroxy-tetrahydrodipicolinate reductase
VDAVIDFTSPLAVLKNIEACTRAGTNMVVGTTGWYDHVPEVRQWVDEAGTGLVFASNFSLGINVFFKAIAAAAAALKHGYGGDILERHHIHKKDAPSGTAVTMRQIVEKASGKRLEIRSEREGEVFGFHQLTLSSAADRIVLTHDATSRRGFAEGAVLAAEWIRGKKGFYEFKDIFDQL